MYQTYLENGNKQEDLMNTTKILEEVFGKSDESKGSDISTSQTILTRGKSVKIDRPLAGRIGEPKEITHYLKRLFSSRI
jgi:hypothetical protein